MRFWKNLQFALLGACMAGLVHAQTYPSGTITIVAPYPPDNTTDLYARAVAKGLEEWGQTTVVDNRAGASGMIGAEFASRKPADGHTLLIGASSMFSVLPLLSKRMAEIYQHIEPVSLLGFNPSYVVVPTTVPAN